MLEIKVLALAEQMTRLHSKNHTEVHGVRNMFLKDAK
jgi:hypothetical protein